MSMLFNLVPWWGRALALIALCTALIGFGWVKGSANEAAKFDAYKLSAAQQTIAIQTATIEKSQALQLKKDEALNAAAEREKKLRATTVALRADVDGLSGDLAASRSELSNASDAAVRRYAAVVNTVFGECASEVARLAGEAQRSSSDALTLLQAWPK